MKSGPESEGALPPTSIWPLHHESISVRNTRATLRLRHLSALLPPRNVLHRPRLHLASHDSTIATGPLAEPSAGPNRPLQLTAALRASAAERQSLGALDTDPQQVSDAGIPSRRPSGSVRVSPHRAAHAYIATSGPVALHRPSTSRPQRRDDAGFVRLVRVPGLRCGTHLPPRRGWVRPSAKSRPPSSPAPRLGPRSQALRIPTAASRSGSPQEAPASVHVALPNLTSHSATSPSSRASNRAPTQRAA